MGQNTILLIQEYADDLRRLGIKGASSTSSDLGYSVLQCFPASMGGPVDLQTEHVLRILDASGIRYTGFGYGLEMFDPQLDDYRTLRPEERKALFSQVAEKEEAAR
jgi:hypothetical protein